MAGGTWSPVRHPAPRVMTTATGTLDFIAMQVASTIATDLSAGIGSNDHRAVCSFTFEPSLLIGPDFQRHVRGRHAMFDPSPGSPPKTLNALKNNIARRKGQLSRKLERLVRFALDHPHDVAFYSAPRLAETCGVSNATVQRLVAFFGFRSYSDLRELFRDDLRERSHLALNRVESIRPARARSTILGKAPPNDDHIDGGRPTMDGAPPMACLAAVSGRCAPEEDAGQPSAGRSRGRGFRHG